MPRSRAAMPGKKMRGAESAPLVGSQVVVRTGGSVPAAAALGRARVVARVERVAAGAGLHRVRIVNGEAGAHEAVDVVDLGAAQVRGAEVVDQDADAVL